MSNTIIMFKSLKIIVEENLLIFNLNNCYLMSFYFDKGYLTELQSYTSFLDKLSKKTAYPRYSQFTFRTRDKKASQISQCPAKYNCINIPLYNYTPVVHLGYNK